MAALVSPSAARKKISGTLLVHAIMADTLARFGVQVLPGVKAGVVYYGIGFHATCTVTTQ